MVRDDTAVHLRRGVVGELEGGLVEREGILAYLVGDAVQEHDPFVELVHRIDRKLVRSHRQVLNIEFIHQRLGLDDLLGFAIHDLDTLRDLILGIGPLQQHTLIARRSRQVRNLARIYRSREVILVQFIHVAARRDSERQQQNA
ncbi:MAG: hypothetical protein BHV65_08875 [Alistipes sp. 58_9_plus]|nr:MAG: hypothetical protein BHV65_08875 [Alistipes sp. 58_9_plus]